MKLRMMLALASVLMVGAAQAMNIEGIELDDRVQMGDAELGLNGAGVRSLFLLKLYVAGLYLPEASHDAGSILNDDGPRRMVLRMMHDVDSHRLLESLHEGLNNNTSETERTRLAGPMAKLEALFRGVKRMREGDVLVLDFSAEGVDAVLNDTDLGTVESPALAHALLRVWLGARPVDAGLKKALLAE